MYSDYLVDQVLGHLFGLSTWTPPSELWFGLSRADPLADESGLDEPVGYNYSRVQYDPGSTNWQLISHVVDNKLVITFNTSSGSWGTITHLGCWDAEAGNFLFYHELSDPTAVGAGATPRYSAGTLDNTAT